MQLSINRRISERLTPWLAVWGFSPDQVTVLSFTGGLLASWNFCQGTAGGWLVGGLLFELSYVLDNCDGELARLTRRVSGIGSWLDLVADGLIHVAFFISLGAGLYRFYSDRSWLVLGAASAAGVVLTYVTFFIQQIRQRGGAAWLHPDPPECIAPCNAQGKLRKVAREDFSLVVLGSAVVHEMRWLLWAGLMGAHLYWVLTALNVLKAGHKCRAGHSIKGEGGGHDENLVAESAVFREF